MAEDTSMATTLDELEAALNEGIRRSGQLSLGRRAPASQAVPYLAKARTGLRGFVKEHPDDARGWRVLSLAEESMLGYGRAIAALERALELGGRRDKRDLKRLGILRATAREWGELLLPPQQLADLGDFLEAKLKTEAMEDDLTWTESWLRSTGLSDDDVQKVIAALKKRGAFSDAQVYHNIVRGG
jgi:hypothetical protein